MFYLLYFEQHHLLLDHVFGKHFKAEQHVRGGDCVQGVGGQEGTLETVLPYLETGGTNVSFLFFGATEAFVQIQQQDLKF